MGAISDFLIGFSRDYENYMTIEKELRGLCEDALCGIQFLWQSRVKTVQSLEKKLRGRSGNYDGEAENVADIVDLVAGRIILADWGDFGRVEEVLKRNFNLRGRVHHPKPGQKAVNLQSRFRGYGGRHFHVRRKRPADQYSTDTIDPVIEIQVMTAYMWAYATVAHDIEYKKLNGEPSEDLVLSLETLKGIANLGEIGLEMFNRQFIPVAKRHSDPSLGLPSTIQTLEATVCLDESDKQCLRDIRRTDPRHDKERIESNKDRLLEGSCSWVLEDPAFLDWWNRNDSRLLWIHGDPGKGKTMIMMALISEISERLKVQPESNVLAYFFCQNTSEDLNTTVSVLRGLIYFLVDQEKKLVRHIRKYYDGAGKDLFEGSNALYALLMILSDILKDQSLGNVFLMIDALDECDVKIHKLIDWIVRNEPSKSSKIKWLVTSRNEPAFSEQLGHNRHLHTSLELNSSHVARAVADFIDYKVKELAEVKLYHKRLQVFVRKSLMEKAEDTFLWVALVCKELSKVRQQKVRSMLENIPAGLIPLYGRMLRQVLHQQDQNDTELSRRILRTVTLAFRPLRFAEISVFAELPIDEDVEEVVGFCGSFLTVREETVYLVHQSAKEYLSDGERKELFPSGKADEHANTVLFCLRIMSNTLRKDICNLKMPGYCLSDIRRSSIEDQIPLYVQYACLHWIDHLHRAGSANHKTLTVGENCKVLGFLQVHFLHWVEALVLLNRTSEAILAVTSFGSLLKTRMSPELSSFVHDARRYLLEFSSMVEDAPLQIYNSALVFCPKTSVVKQRFSQDLPNWIERLPSVEEAWTAILQTLEAGSDLSTEVTFSPDGQLLATAYRTDPAIQIWETSTGALRGTLDGPPMEIVNREEDRVISKMSFLSTNQLLVSTPFRPSVRIWDNVSGLSQEVIDEQLDNITEVTFSPDGHLLALASEHDFTIKIWDPLIGTLRGILAGHTNLINAMAFGPVDGQLLASGADDMTIRLWDSNLGVVRHKLDGQLGAISKVIFSPVDDQLLASVALGESAIQVWDTSSGNLKRELQLVKKSDEHDSVLFTPNGQLLVFINSDTIMMWNSATGAYVDVIQSNVFLYAASSCVSPDSRLLATSSTSDVHLWDLVTGAKHNIFKGHSDHINSMQFSPDGYLLATASCDSTVLLWDAHTKATREDIEEDLEGQSGIESVSFSPCGDLFASASPSGLQVWNSTAENSRSIIDSSEAGSSWPDEINFSPNGQLLAAGFAEPGPFDIRVWDPTTAELKGVFKGHMRHISAIIFSPDGQIMASGSEDQTVRLWDPNTGDARSMLKTSGSITSLAFSNDGLVLASAIAPDKINLWDIQGYEMRAEFGNTGGLVRAMSFSPDSQLLALRWSPTTCEVWDVKSGTLIHKNELYCGGNFCFNEGSQLEISGRLVPIQSSSDDSTHEQVWTNTPYGLHFSGKWVTFKGRKVLKLPKNRQRDMLATHKNSLLLAKIESSDNAFTLFQFSTTLAPPGIE